MISTSNDMTIRLWNSLDGTQIWRYQHSSHINRNAVLVHGGRVVFCDEKPVIYITNASTESHVDSPTRLLDYDGRNILALFVKTQDAKPIMVVATEEYGIQSLEFGSNEFLGKAEYPVFPIKHIAYSRGGSAASSSTLNKALGFVIIFLTAFFAVEGGCALWYPLLSSYKVGDVTSLVHRQRGCRWFSYMSKEHCQSFPFCEPFHEGEVTSMLFSDDGRWLATGGEGEDGKVLIFDAAGGEIVCDSDFLRSSQNCSSPTLILVGRQTPCLCKRRRHCLRVDH